MANEPTSLICPVTARHPDTCERGDRSCQWPECMEEVSPEQWPRRPIESRDDYRRGYIDDDGKPYVDGRKVTVAEYEAFRADWAAHYDATLCQEFGCDGEQGHGGPHFQWVAE